MGASCVLCETPGVLCIVTDLGKRHRINCSSPRCGNYVITDNAMGRLSTGGPQKSVLIEMVRRANKHSKVLEIFVAGDGLLQAYELPRD